MQAVVYYDRVRESIRENGWGDLPGWKDLDESMIAAITPIMDRLALVRSLRSGMATNGEEEDQREKGALQIYLLLTILEMLGRSNQQAGDVDFSSWSAAAGAPHHEEGKAEEVTGARSAGSEAPKVTQPADVKAATAEAPVADPENVAIAHKEFQSLHGHRASFEHVFTKLLDQGLRRRLADSCWVYRDDPIEEWDSLAQVRKGYRETKSPEHIRLTETRKRWDSLTHDKQVLEIAELCALIYQEYSLGFPPASSKNSKDPLPQIMRKAGMAVVEKRVSYLSETAFKKLMTASDHKKFVIDDIECILKDRELYIRFADFNSKDYQEWQNKLLDWSAKSGHKGETIIQHNQNVALVLPDKPVVDHLQDWIHNALKNYIAAN